ncbi:DUF6580 family putative transport protein [Lacipirellula sp.]|uniref:DUF6580 family putative transport protein n=1 Tax=Lacipirellula sp. TaxID=2691419 RepID=UPI003D0C6A72
MNRETRRDLLIFALLLAFGVVGRWAEPAWNFTPLAAVTALGAFYFRSWLPAILLPSTLLVVSDLMLPSHDAWQVQLSVHLMAIVPLMLGRAARNQEGWRRAAFWGMCGFVPATMFYLVTNFAVWASKSLYAPTVAGLMESYAKALPFYRTMLAGDVCYIALMTGCLAAAHLLQPQGLEQLVKRK